MLAVDDSSEELPEILQNVHFLALEGKDTGLLWKVKPTFILVHDPDIAFVRQIEVRLSANLARGRPPSRALYPCCASIMSSSVVDHAKVNIARGTKFPFEFRAMM